MNPQGTLFPQPRILGDHGPFCSMQLSAQDGAFASTAGSHSN
jgi:hypothetical protein